MSANTCQHFDDCSAPICPEDSSSIANCSWFPGEEICRRLNYQKMPIMNHQRRIARATDKDPERGCFTAEMLKQDCRIMKGIHGLDPDAEITRERVHKWLQEHPAITAAERATMRARLPKGTPFRRVSGVFGMPASASPAGSATEIVSRDHLPQEERQRAVERELYEKVDSGGGVS